MTFSTPEAIDADPLRVGIIGVGWGTVAHVPAFRAVRGYEVAALCGRRSERAIAAAERSRITDVSTDWRSFVQRDDLDVISITTPPDSHRDLSIAALAAGKHVLCEKPMAPTERECAEMTEAARAASTSSAICFELRYSPAWATLIDAVTSGVIGTPWLIHVVTTLDLGRPSRAVMEPWMYRLDQGGGFLNGVATHVFDIVRLIAGDVTELTGDVRPVVGTIGELGSDAGVDADNVSALLMRASSGALVVFTLTSLADGTLSERFTVWGSHGSIESVGIWGRQHVEARDPSGAPLELPVHDRQVASGQLTEDRRSSVATRALALMLEDWLPTLTAHTATALPTFSDGRAVQAIVDAARRASSERAWISLGT